METCVITTGLCKRYGSETCVDHLSLQVPEGAVYGFLGPNGAGKTTTLKMLLGWYIQARAAYTCWGASSRPGRGWTFSGTWGP